MHRLYTFLFFLLFSVSLEGSVIYVNSLQESNIGTGETWNTAYHDLQDALAIATYGDEIWVAAGIYLPTTYSPSQDSVDRTASFVIPSGVQLYGGFAGNETSLSERNWELNSSRLSGDINGNFFYGHSFHVITLINTDSTTIIDGFVIEEGAAYAYFLDVGDDKRHGSGIYHLQTHMNSSSSFKVRNCLFRNLGAYDEPAYGNEGGGTIYNETLNGEIDVEVENCRFEEIGGDYEMVYNKTNTENDSISVLFKDCTLQDAMGYTSLVKSNSDNGKVKISFENTTLRRIELCRDLIVCEGDSSLFEISFSDCLIDSEVVKK